ncbi:MAG: T9SS type A sorting domain-containing protein [Crocinitomicaceae bacterium]|jgi:hypothetical protein|nr:T9SS type A sorting domain-containing protein [Crocinitomicaceae bacterium]
MGNLIKIVLFVFCSYSAIGQIKFFKFYTNNGSDQGQGVVQLEDSSYVITGASSSFSGSSQAFLLHVDSLGNYLWSNNYGGPESESGRRVLYKKNFGFFICGFTNSIGSGGFDNYLAKVDELGNLEWEKAYGGEGWEKVHDAALTKDTGVIMVGETSSNFSDNQDIYIVRTDILGDTLWTKTIGGIGDDFATSISSFTDSTFVITGQYYIEDSALVKMYVTYIKDDGTVIWSDFVGNDGNYWSNDFTFVGNQILGVGGCNSVITDEPDPVAYIYDISGFYGGETKSIGPGKQEFKNIASFGPLDAYYITNSSEDDFSYLNGPDLLVMKYSTFPSFAFEGGINIGFENPDVSGEVIRTNDGGAIVVGYSTGQVSGGNEVFLVKIGPNDDYPNTILDVVIDNIVTIKESSIDKSLKIFPNPTNGILNISTENLNYNTIRIISSVGKEISTIDFQLSTKIDVSAFETGLYFIEITGTNSSTIVKQITVK